MIGCIFSVQVCNNIFRTEKRSKYFAISRRTVMQDQNNKNQQNKNQNQNKNQQNNNQQNQNQQKNNKQDQQNKNY